MPANTATHNHHFAPQIRFHDFWRYINLYLCMYVCSFSALTLLVVWQEGQERHLACKKLSGGVLPFWYRLVNVRACVRVCMYVFYGHCTGQPALTGTSS